MLIVESDKAPILVEMLQGKKLVNILVKPKTEGAGFQYVQLVLDTEATKDTVCAAVSQAYNTEMAKADAGCIRAARAITLGVGTAEDTETLQAAEDLCIGLRAELSQVLAALRK